MKAIIVSKLKISKKYYSIYITETSTQESSGSPHFLIGIMVGLVSTLVILAFLVVLLIKVHTRRHPPPTFDTGNAGGGGAGNNPSSSAASGGPPRLNNAGLTSSKGPFHTSSSSPGSDDPDLIPLQANNHSRLGILSK
jgi:hypothetical protein